MMHAPQIPGLKVNQILEESRRHTDIDAYMPDLKDGKLPNRDFVVNVGQNTFMHYVDSGQHFTRNNAENGWKFYGTARR